MLAITSQDLAVIEAALDEVPILSDARTKALAVFDKLRLFTAEPALIDEAREIAAEIADEEDRISFDDEASTSPSDDGTFVSCWLWVPNE